MYGPTTQELMDAMMDFRDAVAASFAQVPTRAEMNARFDHVDGRFDRLERRATNVEDRLTGVETAVEGLKSEVVRLQRHKR